MPSSPILRSAVIASPCHERWDQMAAAGPGRFCFSCEKTVLDFAAMTPSQIAEATETAEGHLCARVSRDASGKIMTLAEPVGRPRYARAAGFVLASALAGSAAAQTSAAVSGRAVQPKRMDDSQPSVKNAEVIFVRDDVAVSKTSTDDAGMWKATVAPGRYDIILRGGLLGERIHDVDLHDGSQSFGTVTLRLLPGDLHTKDETATVMVGEVVTNYRYPASYLFKHPLRYLRHLPHNFG